MEELVVFCLQLIVVVLQALLIAIGVVLQFLVGLVILLFELFRSAARQLAEAPQPGESYFSWKRMRNGLTLLAGVLVLIFVVLWLISE